MNCRNARKLVFEFIDGLEDDTQRLELEKHLALCPECDKLATRLTRSLDFLHRAPVEKTSDNFAWKVRLKLNQERNTLGERGVSYGALIRRWNLRYAATAVAAAAVVLVVGLYAVRSGLMPISTSTPTSRVAERGLQSEDATPSSERVANAETPDQATGSNVRRGIPDLAEQFFPGSNIRPVPYFGSTNRIPVSQGAPGDVFSSPLLGVIDRPTPMTVAEFDSLLNTQMMGLSPDLQRQYLNQYIVLLQRHLMGTMMNRSGRR